MTPVADDPRPMRVGGGVQTAEVRVTTGRAWRLTEDIRPEDELAASVARAMAYLLPSDAVFTAWDLSNAKSKMEGGRKKRIGCISGWPDCGVFWRGRVVLIELKRPRYGVLSDAQKALHPRLEATGFPVTVCRSAPEALDVVAAAGVPLRGRIAA